MASDVSRASAKGAIRDSETTDPELDAALAAGTNLQLDMLKEKHRHDEANADRELGRFGKMFGGEKNAPTFFAGVAVVAGLAMAIVSMILAGTLEENVAFWSAQIERAFAFVSAALGFLFGRSSNKQ